jgi:hypothetical protein
MNPILFPYLLMMLFQIFHIFEEIGMGAYKIAHSLKKYLFVAAILVTINYTAFYLILIDVRAGYFMGLFTSGVLAIGNGLIHFFGWLKTRQIRDHIGAGMFTGFPLAIVGIIVLIQIAQYLFG